MAPGARRKFGAAMFEPDVFREQMYCIEESACDIVGTFRRLGNCASLVPSRYVPDGPAVFRSCNVLWPSKALVCCRLSRNQPTGLCFRFLP